LLDSLKKVWVAGQQLRISRQGHAVPPATPGKRPGGKSKPRTAAAGKAARTAKAGKKKARKKKS